MAKKVDTVESLKEYFMGVTSRANHHAHNVNQIIYALLGIVVFKKDDGTDIEVRSYGSETGNILWVFVNGVRYAFRYEHSNGSIEIRRNSYTGPILLTVSNATPIVDILTIF